jgi:uncharacterized membrane protein
MPDMPLLRPGRRSTVQSLLRRVIFGTLFVLPMLLTIFVVYQIYSLLHAWVIAPIAKLIIPQGLEGSFWKGFEFFLAPIVSLSVVFLILYLLGYAFQTRLSRWIDWLFSSIPGVSILYRAIRDASQAMQGPDGLKNIDTVVLVPFPHPGARACGFLMGESVDATTQQRLACVYVPIALFPPSGYTLIFAHEQITPTGWDATTPWKLLLSGGLTIPNSTPFTSPSNISDNQ